MEPKTPEHSMIQVIECLSGCLGGMAGVVAGQPFDTVKVRLQTQGTQKRYRGVWHSLSSIVKEETPKGLFKGMTAPLPGAAVINTIVFGVEGQVSRYIGKKTTYTEFISGGIAGAVQTVVCSPVDLAKTQMQVQGIGVKTLPENAYKSSYDCMRRIYKNYGLRGCCKGMVSTLFREAPSFAVYFATFHYLTADVFAVDDTQTFGLGDVMKMGAAGGISGIATWVSTYPVDVIKSRIQADSFENPEFKGAIDCIFKGLKKEGPMLFWRGLNSTIVRAFAVNAATFPVFHVSRQYLLGE